MADWPALGGVMKAVGVGTVVRVAGGSGLGVPVGAKVGVWVAAGSGGSVSVGDTVGVAGALQAASPITETRRSKKREYISTSPIGLFDDTATWQYPNRRQKFPVNR